MGQCFNLKYSPDGRYLLAAFEGGYIDILSSSSETIERITGAHEECVNNFCWLSGDKFASCGDDANILTWDVRFLNKPMQLVKVASNCRDVWIKDLHLVPKTREHAAILLANSGFISRIGLNDALDLEPLDQIRSLRSVFHATGGISEQMKIGRTALIQSNKGAVIEHIFCSPVKFLPSKKGHKIYLGDNENGL